MVRIVTLLNHFNIRHGNLSLESLSDVVDQAFIILEDYVVLQDFREDMLQDLIL